MDINECSIKTNPNYPTHPLQIWDIWIITPNPLIYKDSNYPKRIIQQLSTTFNPSNPSDSQIHNTRRTHMHDKTDPAFKIFLVVATIYFILHGIVALMEHITT